MKISKIEFENFRNFKDHGELSCSTDGKMTIIYGKNGDGKTTLHQFFKWLFFDEIRFNKTSTEKLYNLQYEREVKLGDTFTVFGRVDFEHEGEQYSLTRTYKYRKDLNESTLISRDMDLMKMNDDYDWRRVEEPNIAIEKMLPPGLADYFFFDGESMIADLKLKEKDSANKLKKSLYSMFDLDILELAISHIGRKDLRTTILGKLYLSKSQASSSSDLDTLRYNIVSAQDIIGNLDSDLKKIEEEKLKLSDNLKFISEKIGSKEMSTKILEEKRKENLNNRNIHLQTVKECYKEFGDEVIQTYPKLFISKKIMQANFNLEISKNILPEGLNKRLINFLLNNDKCICGHQLNMEDKKYLSNYLELLPPHSFTEMYNNLMTLAKEWQSHYDYDKLVNIISKVIKYKKFAEDCDRNIKEIDSELESENNKEIDKLLDDRKVVESRLKEIEKNITENNKNRDKYGIYLNKQMKDYEQKLDYNKNVRITLRKEKIMEEVLKRFENRLNTESKMYSEKLQNNIQNLIDRMLTSKRTVRVSPEFSVRIVDNYDDESKSEGQFAVVSFAYIGGILKMLKETENLKNKEYPLILDGPFSKLDFDQRQNVIDTLPDFASQVIIFSKDDLRDYIKPDKIGKVWTLFSNDEKNVAIVKEGHLWK